MKRITSLVVLSLVLAAGTARAEPPLADSLQGEAKREYEAGRRLLEINDSQGAYAKFKHAYELAHDPRLVWNMAVCEKELHHYAKAVVLVDQYLRDAGDLLTPEMRDRAVATREALKDLYSPATLEGAPNGARVFVDDRLVGTTPLLDPLALDLGAHRVRLEHEGFEPAELAVDDVTGGGQALVLKATMTPLANGSLHVVAAAGDTIVIDGKVVGSDHWDGDLAAGRHTLRVTALRKKTYDVGVDIAPRGSRTINVTLQTEDGPLWPWIAGGAVVVAGAIVGGYFLFRPDEKPAPYTQGGLATVMLPASLR